MTAEEWEKCQDPELLVREARHNGSPRRQRLAACAFTRMAWGSIRDPRARLAVDVAERYADGLADDRELEAARVRANDVAEEMGWAKQGPARAFCWVAAPAPGAVALPCVLAARPRFRRDSALSASLAALARCVFANPFRPPVTFSLAVLVRNDGAAVKLARVIYDERDPVTGLLDTARLAILADALEEAGALDRAALEHLRGPGPHCRGCHCVDAVLGKN